MGRGKKQFYNFQTEIFGALSELTRDFSSKLDEMTESLRQEIQNEGRSTREHIGQGIDAAESRIIERIDKMFN